MPRRRRPAADEVLAVQRLLTRERLSIDETNPARTCFLSHLGAAPKLLPAPWIGHRDLLYALALANLTPAQRSSLARALLVEYGREFGVGRLKLEAASSGLPLGGSSVRLRQRRGGPTCLYTWGVGRTPAAAPCDWLLLRTEPGWALDEPPAALHSGGLATLAAVAGGTAGPGGEVLVLVDTAVAAHQVAQACGGAVQMGAHPRFAPHLEGLNPEAPVLLWPHDALDAAGLRRREVVAVVLVDAPESVEQEVRAWIRARGGKTPEIVHRACPGRADRDTLAAFWRSCGEPRILLRGDPGWAHAGGAWLHDLGADVVVQGEATQLELW